MRDDNVFVDVSQPHVSGRWGASQRPLDDPNHIPGAYLPPLIQR
jgi:hypothetical protein